MTRGVKFRRGSTLDHNGYTGLEGEITVNTDKDCLVVHDGATLGGFEQVSLASTQTLTNKTLTSPIISNPIISNPSITGVATVTTLGVTGLSTSRNLSVIGISTFTSGPVLVGSATSTGTADQDLQVTGGAYVSGNFGIGSTNPTQPLHIKSNANELALFEANGPTSAYVTFSQDSTKFGYVGSATGFVVTGNASDLALRSDNDLIFAIGNSEKLRLNNSGSFLIGSGTSTGTSSQPLQVTGGAYVSGNLGIGTTNPTARLDLAAGTASANTSPLKFNSGVVLTTPESGAIEYDGNLIYATPKAARGLILSPQFYVLNADRTGPTAASTPTSALGVTATLKAGTRYLIELYLSATKSSLNSCALQLQTTSSTGTIDRTIFRSVGSASAARTTLANGQVISNNVAGHITATSVGAANASANSWHDLVYRSWVDVNTGGDVTGYDIQLLWSNTPTTSSFAAGANISIYPMGPVGSNTSIGSWV